MKVSQNLPPSAQSIEQARNQPATQKGKVQNSGTSAPSPESLGVEISDQAKLMKQAADIAKSAPDSRADRVQQLKKAIQSGTYKIEAGAIADKLIEDHLNSDFGKNNL